MTRLQARIVIVLLAVLAIEAGLLTFELARSSAEPQKVVIVPYRNGGPVWRMPATIEAWDPASTPDPMDAESLDLTFVACQIRAEMIASQLRHEELMAALAAQTSE